MKFIKYLLLIITSVVFIAACQKELSFDIDGVARGTLKEDATTNECLPSTVNGIYKADSILNNTNFIDIQVNLTSTGTYDIVSDTINGYSFRGTGTFGLVGLNTVRLYATGKPVVAGVDAFTIKFDNSTCIVNVIVIGASTGAAVFTLQGAPGTCSGAIINGTYTVGTVLTIDNTATITVNVITPGTYFLGAATINGMVFSSTGYFPNTGIQSVTLNGTGVPLTAGAFNVTASNGGSSNCTFSVTVAAGSGPATYSLDVTAGACSGATYTGTYAAGVPLAGTNVVLVNVTVTTLGTYTITTDTNNGMTFSGSGTFLTTGTQPVPLTGSGTPVANGIFNFTATAGTSTCTFSVTVTSDNLDYLPETTFSNWSDKLVGGTAADTSYWQVSPNSIVKSGLTYRIFEIKNQGITVDSFYQRKNGGLYYQYYDGAFGNFDAPFNKDGLLLDSNLAVNASWVTDLGNNTWSGLPATALIECLITAKGVTAVIAGNTYTNIIKVQYTFNYNLGSGNIVYATEESWYAKGKGIVYDKYQDFPVTTTLERETTRQQIF